MCGIMGYIGGQQAWDIVLSGLKRLEYRGYDSAGVVTLSGQKLRLARQVGHISALEKSQPEPLVGTIGIGHTRWATHGGVSVKNCHPHRDSTERVAIVHNGIIDNMESLKAELSKEGVTFRSETDSEVLAELVGRGLGRGRRVPRDDRHDAVAAHRVQRRLRHPAAARRAGVGAIGDGVDPEHQSTWPSGDTPR